MAVTTETSLQACLNLIEPLENIVGGNSPEMVKEMTAVYSALKSPQNTAGLSEPRVISNDGKNLTVQYDYFEPDCTAVGTTEVDFCGLDPTEAGTPKKSLQFTFDNFVNRSGKISYEDYRAICETPNEVRSFELVNAAYECIREMNRDLYAQMLAYGDTVGADNSATDPIGINLLNSTGNVNMAGLVKLKTYFSKYGNTPLTVGGVRMQQAQDIIRLASRTGGNTYDPVAILAGMPIWTDHMIDEVYNITLDPTESVADSSYAVSWLPGAFRLIEGYNNVGIYEVLNRNEITRTTVEIMGVQFDLYTKFDPECMQFIWLLQKKYALFAVPQATYQDCEDYISKLNFTVGCGDWDCAQF